MEIINNTIDLTESSGGGAVINNEDITVTTNGVYTASEGYTGLGEVTVNVPQGSGIAYTGNLNFVPIGNCTVDSNGIMTDGGFMLDLMYNSKIFHFENYL